MLPDSIAEGEVYMDSAREANGCVARQSRDATREVVGRRGRVDANYGTDKRIFPWTSGR